MEQPIRDEIAKLQQIKGFVVPDLSVLRGMLNAIEAKRHELRRALADAERQSKAQELCLKRIERIEQTIGKITEITEVLYPRYATEPKVTQSITFLSHIHFRRPKSSELPKSMLNKRQWHEHKLPKSENSSKTQKSFWNKPHPTFHRKF